MKDKFNKYCAEVMGYRIDGLTWYNSNDEIISSGEKYNPYDDLNQMAEVFDKLILTTDFILMRFYTYDSNMNRIGVPVADAMRDVIISTMEKE